MITNAENKKDYKAYKNWVNGLNILLSSYIYRVKPLSITGFSPVFKTKIARRTTGAKDFYSLQNLIKTRKS